MAATAAPQTDALAAVESTLMRVAVLLAVTAMAAAIVGARVSILSGDASGKWGSAVRLEVKRSAGAQESVRYLYDVEMPLAIRVMEARLILARLNALPASAGAGQAVQVEKLVQTEILKVFEPGSTLTQPGYALPNGGVNLGKGLADLRAENPVQLALDPEGVRAQADRMATKAFDMSLPLLLFGFCALLGALAKAFAARRLLLLRLGWGVLGLGAVLALVIEVTL
jgi:hypothetical protein